MSMYDDVAMQNAFVCTWFIAVLGLKKQCHDVLPAPKHSGARDLTNHSNRRVPRLLASVGVSNRSTFQEVCCLSPSSMDYFILSFHGTPIGCLQVFFGVINTKIYKL